MTKEIPLTQGYVALVDDDMYDTLVQWSWHYDGIGYACRMQNYICDGKQRTRKLRMHRVILGLTDSSIHVDHINHDRLDNQRSNLRTCTLSQNAMNRPPKRGSSSRYKGVGWHKHTQKWQAYVFNGKQKIYLGVYKSEIDAAHAHDAAAVIYHGEFANLNFPERYR